MNYRRVKSSKCSPCNRIQWLTNRWSVKPLNWFANKLDQQLWKLREILGSISGGSGADVVVASPASSMCNGTGYQKMAGDNRSVHWTTCFSAPRFATPNEMSGLLNYANDKQSYTCTSACGPAPVSLSTRPWWCPLSPLIIILCVVADLIAIRMHVYETRRRIVIRLVIGQSSWFTDPS